jgi:hypothetical protein
VSAEAAATKRLAQRLAVEIVNKELAEARLDVQRAEITSLRSDVEKLERAVAKAARKPRPKK